MRRGEVTSLLSFQGTADHTVPAASSDALARTARVERVLGSSAA
jgi:hypothetical protein